MEIPIHKIKVPERPIDFGLVQELATSIKKFGLITPIRVDMKLNLLSGLHRFEACKRLDKTMIRVEMFNQPGISSELFRLEETLVRRHFSSSELEKLKEKKAELYAKVFPKKQQRKISTDPIESLSEANKKSIADGISPYVRSQLEGLEFVQSDLHDLAQMKEEEQLETIEEMTKKEPT